MKKILFPFLALMLVAVTALISCSKPQRLFVGGFTGSDGEKAMTVFDFKSNGSLKMAASADVGPNPSYFCIRKGSDMIYVINEVMEFRGQPGGGLSTFRYDDRKVTFMKLNEMVIPYGGPCYISMSADRGHLLIANYPKGSVVVVKLDEEGIPEAITDTILYVRDDPGRSHAHMILNDPAGKYVYVTDLGLDRIVIYDFDPVEGKLHRIENGITALPEGSGPRHFVFNSDGSRLYVINELGSTVAVFAAGEAGGLRLLQIIGTRKGDDNKSNYCADIHLSRDGKFLYGSNRGDNNIVTYRIGGEGLLEPAGHSTCGGDWPRNFIIDPSGKFLIAGNQKSDNISVFRINAETGLPSVAIDTAVVRMPACLKFH